MLQFNVTKLAAGLIVAVIFGWILIIGKSLLLPVLLGIIGIYILDSTASTKEEQSVHPTRGQQNKDIRKSRSLKRNVL